MYITYALIAITVVVSFLAWKYERLMSKLIMNPHQVYTRNEYYRFITSGFVHKDHMHLLWNIFSFYFFGRAIEFVFRSIFGGIGDFYFIILYIVAIIVSDLSTYLKHKKNSSYNSLGASGGVSAVIFAFIIFRPLDSICIYFALCFPGFIMGALYIIFSWYQGRKSNDNINHDAHLYGALFGLLFCIVLYPAAIGDFIDQIKDWMF